MNNLFRRPLFRNFIGNNFSNCIGKFTFIETGQAMFRIKELSRFDTIKTVRFITGNLPAMVE